MSHGGFLISSGICSRRLHICGDSDTVLNRTRTHGRKSNHRGVLRNLMEESGIPGEPRNGERVQPPRMVNSGVERKAQVGAWLSLVERLVRDQEAGGSNPLAPTIRYRASLRKAYEALPARKPTESRSATVAASAPVQCIVTGLPSGQR